MTEPDRAYSPETVLLNDVRIESVRNIEGTIVVDVIFGDYEETERAVSIGDEDEMTVVMRALTALREKIK